MGEADKGWTRLEGRPLVAHVLERFEPQVDEVLISANRNVERYAALGHTVVTDAYPGFAGPLAGLHAALTHARFDLVATVPCDSPFLPLDLVRRLHAALEARKRTSLSPTPPAVAIPFLPVPQRRVRSAGAFLDSGQRKFETWYKGMRFCEVDFDDQPEAFRNINTPEDLANLRLPRLKAL